VGELFAKLNDMGHSLSPLEAQRVNRPLSATASFVCMRGMLSAATTAMYEKNSEEVTPRKRTISMVRREGLSEEWCPIHLHFIHGNGINRARGFFDPCTCILHALSWNLIRQTYEDSRASRSFVVGILLVATSQDSLLVLIY